MSNVFPNGIRSNSVFVWKHNVVDHVALCLKCKRFDGLHFRHCDPSCFRFHCRNIARDFLRSNGMYAFVHLTPLLISRRFWSLCLRSIRSVLPSNKYGDDAADHDEQRLSSLLSKKMVAICRSSLFFVSVQHVSKLIQVSGQKRLYWNLLT